MKIAILEILCFKIVLNLFLLQQSVFFKTAKKTLSFLGY